MIDYGKRDLLGVRIDALDVECAVDRIAHHARLRQPLKVTALAVHGLVESTRDDGLRHSLNDFDLVLPDGMPVRWALDAIHHLDLPEKVPGPTVVDRLLEVAAAEGLRVYFYGSTPETLEGIERELAKRFGGTLDLVSSPSRFSSVDRAAQREIVEQINASEANICFVGLGCPRQEKFVARLGGDLHMPSLAVGAAFDYIAGTIDRAPDLMQKAGLEWLYRTAQEPRRLAGRYLDTNSRFVAKATKQLALTTAGRAPAPAVSPPASELDQDGPIDA